VPEAVAAREPAQAQAPRHSAVVRVTHWITTLCFAALLLSGLEIVVSHPRFYWGETGNIHTAPLFRIPIPASRSSVPTGFAYTMPDQNGWSRALHFQTAWAIVLTGLLYVLYTAAATRFCRDDYNPLQRRTYAVVVFVLFPLMIWTGLAMSPAIASAFPFAVTAFGGQQSARTLHFFLTILLVLFVAVHIVMVCRNGFRKLMRGMITGRTEAS
jgi:thiosulfate reductase cytochrome b subunit